MCSVVALLGLGLILVQVDAFDRIYSFSRAYEHWEVDEWIMVLFASPAVLLIFAARRLFDARREVARRLEAEEAIAALARTDSLTGLPNRRYFQEEINRRAERINRHGGNLAILQLDLDHFKSVNDRLGHAAGDYVLKEVAQTIQYNLRQEDMVARVGGDEFLIACDVANDADAISRLGQRLVDALAEPITFCGETCRVGASIGIAFHGHDPAGKRLDPDRLMMNADIALYRAKETGRGRCEVFTQELRSDFEERRTLASEIQHALHNDEFEAHYQLQVDAAKRTIVGVEALARWRHPTRGLLAPAAFLAAAEECGALVRIDAQILDQAMHDFQHFGFLSRGIRRLAVNVSACRLADDKLLEVLHNPKREGIGLVFELTETVVFDSLDQSARNRLDEIKRHGIELEIDDFGTGNASISAVMAIEPTRIKIDGTLIAPIVDSLKQRELVRAIVSMARSLEIDVTAEGVETEEHATIATALGCGLLQGYVFSRPMTADKLTDFIDAGRWQPETGNPNALRQFMEANSVSADPLRDSA
ncbi:MAG: EAL domain-containing protein [Pseudomonadota bacterium]